MAALEKEGLHPLYHQLDIDNEESVIRLRYEAPAKYMVVMFSKH